MLQTLLSGMEDRKDNVQKMQTASEEVIDLIGDDSQMSRNIKSQVSDIHDCWNTNVRQLIEAISKVCKWHLTSFHLKFFKQVKVCC